ncbi:MAG: amidohydrolase family protein, partial [Clostridiales bacterium]|nr:amidohydrolase family protein [Clostridiales bacterium]
MKVPGFVDLHVHFREPGEPLSQFAKQIDGRRHASYRFPNTDFVEPVTGLEKEDIGSGAAAARAGGYACVCMMPNTQPAIDSAETLLAVDARGRTEGGAAGVRIFAACAMTAGQRGKELCDFEALDQAPTLCRELTGHGVCGISEDGQSLADEALMARVCAEAKRLGLVILDHAQDPSATPMGWSMNAGAVARRLGLTGISCEAEENFTARDIALAQRTGARFHIQHISTAGSVALLRAAKRDGIPVTGETAPHYFTLTEEAVESLGANAKMNPPLRTERDRQAVIEGLCDGTIDC